MPSKRNAVRRIGGNPGETGEVAKRVSAKAEIAPDGIVSMVPVAEAPVEAMRLAAPLTPPRTLASPQTSVILTQNMIPAPLRTKPNIDRDDPIRLVGDCKTVVARGVLDYAKSPLVGELDGLMQVISGHSVAMLCLAAKETQYGKTASAKNNAWNTIDGTDGKTFSDYASWSLGAAAAMRRFNDYSFKDGIYEPEISIADFHYTYIGGPQCRATDGKTCANNETKAKIELAIQQFVDRANRIILANGNTEPGKPTTDPQFPAPTVPDVPTKPPTGQKVVFGRVPKPKNYEQNILAPGGVNGAWDNLGARRIKGIILHRMIGTLLGTNSYFAGEARNRALTDFGTGIGRVIRWIAEGAAVAPWASGPADGIDGDGTAFWNAYGASSGIGASVFNRDCYSIEIEGLTYESPIPADTYSRIVELMAYIADRDLKIPYYQFPLNNDGVHCVLGHSEVTDQKPCAGSVVYELVGQMIVDTANYMKTFQLVAA